MKLLAHTMELTLTEIDRYRLESLRFARLVEVLPPLSGLLMSVVGSTLCIELPYGLLGVAAIALGVNQIELYADEQMLCRLVESNNNTQDTTMTATLELEREPKITTDDVISWRIIASSTGETEADIKKRSHSLGINFRWVGDEGDWGVLTQDAQVLASRYYIDMGNAIALSLGGEQTTPAAVQSVKPEEPLKEKRRSSKPPINFEAEFKPTKNPKVTAERYLAAIAPEKDKQLQILHNIVIDANVARRHLNKALANMSADLKDSTTRAKLQAAFTNLHERVSKPSDRQETEKTTDASTSENNVVN